MVFPDDEPEGEDDPPILPNETCIPGEMWVTDNPVVGTLYSPTGDVLLEVYERPPFGFRP